MKHIQGISRGQMTLFPEALDDYIAEENPVRFLDELDENDEHEPDEPRPTKEELPQRRRTSSRCPAG